ncbi:RidA family protein [Tellurirhabdus bombi]|uniref:RidA family protein n=1 Tax=Tellurirhabdus bombi TaxID=2907205 RepID=UPI001F2D912B|nr:RidA family protein [Tellurirhabdus bombi]
MQKRLINPWKWQNQLGYSQAIETAYVTHTLYCSGQAAMNEQGQPVGSTMSEQLSSCFDNLDTILQQAGYDMENVIRLNFYTTSVESFFQDYEKVITRLTAANCTPTSTLTEVKALAFPQLLIEMEATAVK